MHYSFTVTSNPTQSWVSFSPTSTINTGASGVHQKTWLLELSTQGKIAIALAISDTSSDETFNEVIDYQKLAQEHAELIAQGKTSVVIARWIGDKLNIPSWKASEFYWERKVLSSPKKSEEMERLKKFVEVLGISWSKVNLPSENHPQYLLLDSYTQNALFGSWNMIKIDKKLREFNNDWERMWRDIIKKTTYLLEKTGLDIKWDWLKLTGFRAHENHFGGKDSLYASGSLAGDWTQLLWVEVMGSQFRGYDDNGSASFSYLCFLA